MGQAQVGAGGVRLRGRECFGLVERPWARVDLGGAEDRLQGVAHYATLGLSDFVTIVEDDDAETMTHLSIDLGWRGTVNVTSVPAVAVEDLLAELKGHQPLAAAPVIGARPLRRSIEPQL